MVEERKRVWIDTFQTRSVRRILAYLVIYLFVLGNLLFIWRLLNEGPGDPLEQYFRSFADHAPAVVCLVVLMPILAWDTVKFSHRLVGPVVRFRRAMQEIAEGQPIRPIKLREGDFLTEMRDDFNRMLETLQKQGVPVLLPTDAADQRQTA